MALDDPNEMEFEDLNGQQAQEEPVQAHDLEEFEPEPVETPVEEHEDEEDYGKKVQKRIAKEVSKRKALEDKLAEQQAYIANLHNRMSGVEQHFAKEQAQQAESEMTTKLSQLKEQRRKAYEEGDLETYEKLDDEYLDAKAEALARRAAGNQPRSQQVQPQAQQAPQPPREQQGWLEQNKGWFNGDPNNAHKVQAANAMFDVLKAEGYDDTDPDIYQELDKRLTAAGIKAAARQRQRDPTAAPPNRYAGGSEGRKGFTNEDAAIMRKYGMNPSDPKQRASFIQDRDGTSIL